MNRWISLILIVFVISLLPSCEKAKELVGRGDAGITAEGSGLNPQEAEFLRARTEVTKAYEALWKKQDASLAETKAAPAAIGACAKEFGEASAQRMRLNETADKIQARQLWVLEKRNGVLRNNPDTDEALKQLGYSPEEITKSGQAYLAAYEAYRVCLKANAPKKS
jgi:hypothetical protein